MTIPLYDYQSKTVTLLKDKIAQGKKRIVIVLPTGSGKTNIAAHIIRSARDKDKKVIFLAHRQELVYQAHERLAQFGVDTGIIMAGHPVTDHEINVASVQTLVRRQHPPADIIFVDECFPKGTMVDGREIEKLKRGDIVCSFNHKTNSVEKKKILETIHRQYDGDWYKIKTSSGREIVCTEEHPIYIIGYGYISANKLLHLHDASVIISNYEMPILPKRNPVKNISGKILFENIKKIYCFLSKSRSRLQILRQEMLWQRKTKVAHCCKMPILSSSHNQKRQNSFIQILQLELCRSSKKKANTTNNMSILQQANTNKTIKQNQSLQILQHEMRVVGDEEENKRKGIACSILPYLWNRNHRKNKTDHATLYSRESWVLLSEVQHGIQEKKVFRNNEKNKSEISTHFFSQNEKKQSYEQARNKGKNDKGYARENFSFEGWKWKTHKTANINTQCNWFAYGIYNKYCTGKRQIQKLTTSLQSRFSSPRSNACNRSGWKNAPIKEMEIPGYKENKSFKFDRLESVEIYKQGSGYKPEWVPRENTVYNIHVEGNENYFANGILVHNCHHTNSQSYVKLIKNYPNAYVFGLTATPYRSDGKPLGEIFQDIIAPISIQELIDQKFLVRPRYFGAKQDFSDIHIKMGDYDNKELFAKVDKKILYDGVVEKFKQFGHGKTLVFCVNVQHSIKTCEAFTDAGYAAAHLDADTDTQTRKRILKEFAEGKWQILCNVALFTEGFDLPAINTIILNRATKSKGLYFQMCGRGIRTAKDKDQCIIIDHGNNVYEHGFIEAEQEYDIHAKKKKKKGNTVVVDQVKQCPKCQSLVGKRTQICYHCGFEFPEIHEVVEAEFEEIIIKKVVIPSHLRKPWSKMSDEELEEYRLLKGYQRGWVFFQKKLREKKINPKLIAPFYINKEAKETPGDTLTELKDYFGSKLFEKDTIYA